MKNEEKIAIFDRFQAEIAAGVEKAVEDFKYNNPNASHKEALDSVLNDIIVDAEDMGFYDFFECILYHMYDYPTMPNNPYLKGKRQNIMKDICVSFTSIPEILAKNGAF